MRLISTITAALVAACLLIPAADAAPVNCGATLYDQDNQPIKDGEGKVLTLGRAAAMALMSQYQDDSAVSAEDKIRRGTLGLKVYGAIGNIDLSAEDVVLIKKYIAKLYPPLIVVRAGELLEGRAAQPEKLPAK